MPAFDGTGPLGRGPMTGRGNGYCALVLPLPEEGVAPYGYAGLQGRPVCLGDPPPEPQAAPLASLRRGRRRRRGWGR